MSFNQDEDWVIITGAGSGIGYVTAIHLQSLNIKVLALVKQKKDMEKFSEFEKIVTTKVDVRLDDDIIDLLEFIEMHQINPKVLINNAGILELGLLSTTSISTFQKIFEVNVFGVHRVTQALLPSLIKNKGKIIIMGSDGGLVNFKISSIYCMTKHALEVYADGLHDELKNLGVGVIILEPGTHYTPIFEKAFNRWESPDNIVHESFDDELTNMRELSKKAIVNFKSSRDPLGIAQKILEIIYAENPKKNYLLTDKEESKHVIRSNFEKLALLNKYNKFQFTNDEMHEFLDFSLNLD